MRASRTSLDDALPQRRELALQALDRPPQLLCLAEQAEPLLVVVESELRPADDVVHRRARRALVLRDLRQRPVAAEVQVENAALVRRQERAVALVEGEKAAAGLEGVKCHALTVYQG